MPAKRGRTISSFGQTFSTISGGITFVPPVTPPEPEAVAQTSTKWQPVPRRMRKFLLRGIVPDEQEEKEILEIIQILDELDD